MAINLPLGRFPATGPSDISAAEADEIAQDVIPVGTGGRSRRQPVGKRTCTCTVLVLVVGPAGLATRLTPQRNGAGLLVGTGHWAVSTLH